MRDALSYGVTVTIYRPQLAFPASAGLACLAAALPPDAETTASFLWGDALVVA